MPPQTLVRFETTDGTVLAVGYTSVLYGDHGPYVEFDKVRLLWPALYQALKRSGEHGQTRIPMRPVATFLSALFLHEKTGQLWMQIRAK